jgi:hypothetical protein
MEKEMLSIVATSAIVSDQEQVALWKVALEAVTAGIAEGGGRCCGGVAGGTASELSWSLSTGGEAGGVETRILRRGGGPHSVSRSGRGALEWSKHWTSAVQYFSLEASLIQSLREPCWLMVVVGTHSKRSCRFHTMVFLV